MVPVLGWKYKEVWTVRGANQDSHTGKEQLVSHRAPTRGESPELPGLSNGQLQVKDTQPHSAKGGGQKGEDP